MTLDPALAEILKAIPSEVELPIDWPGQRANAASLLPLIVGPAPVTEVAAVEARNIDGPGGPVPLRIYRPTKPTAITLHYIHGGGWTIGDLDTVDHTIRYLCEALPAVIVSSTYRLAPEHPFPAAYEDSLAAAQWVLDNVDTLGGDARQVVIAGDSAGGNLAATTAIGLRDAARERGETGPHPLKAQLLLYPSVDLRAEGWAFPSRVANADPSLQADTLRATADAYIGDSDPNDWRLSPLGAQDLSGLPPALIVVLSVDPLRDEAIAYAERLRQAGGRAEVIEFSNLIHGFTHLRRIIPAAAVASDEVLEQFRSLLHTT